MTAHRDLEKSIRDHQSKTVEAALLGLAALDLSPQNPYGSMPRAAWRKAPGALVRTSRSL